MESKMSVENAIPRLGNASLRLLVLLGSQCLGSLVHYQWHRCRCATADRQCLQRRNRKEISLVPPELLTVLLVFRFCSIKSMRRADDAWAIQMGRDPKKRKALVLIGIVCDDEIKESIDMKAVKDKTRAVRRIHSPCSSPTPTLLFF